MSDLEAVVEKLFPGGSIESIVRSLLPNSDNRDDHPDSVVSEQQSQIEKNTQKEENLEFPTASDVNIGRNEEDSYFLDTTSLGIIIPSSFPITQSILALIYY